MSATTVHLIPHIQQHYIIFSQVILGELSWNLLNLHMGDNWLEYCSTTSYSTQASDP